jgi:hypothetical protein
MNKMTRKLMTLGLVGTACLALAGCGAPEEPATSQETAAHMSPAPAPQDSNDSAGAVSAMNSQCFIWKGLGGAPPGYLTTYAQCVCSCTAGWSFYSYNNGVNYYRAAIDGVTVSPWPWAVFSSLTTTATTSLATYNSFTSGTDKWGNCNGCLF